MFFKRLYLDHEEPVIKENKERKDDVQSYFRVNLKTFLNMIDIGRSVYSTYSMNGIRDRRWMWRRRSAWWRRRTRRPVGPGPSATISNNTWPSRDSRSPAIHPAWRWAVNFAPIKNVWKFLFGLKFAGKEGKVSLGGRLWLKTSVVDPKTLNLVWSNLFIFLFFLWLSGLIAPPGHIATLKINNGPEEIFSQFGLSTVWVVSFFSSILHLLTLFLPLAEKK